MDKQLLQAALVGLEHRRAAIDQQPSEVRRMLGGSALTDGDVSSVAAPPVRKRSRMSTAGRARIAEAQRKRWAAARVAALALPMKAAPAKKATPKKRTMSAEGKKRIIAATKKRWAAFRAAKKAAAK